MRISVLLPLLIVLGGCSKPEPVDQKDQADQTVNMQSPKESLEDSIVGKVITLEMKEKEMQVQMMFNANGVMLVGADGNMQDLGLTYKVDDHKVLVFEDGERDGGMLFSSSSPKVGDQVEMGPEDNKRNVTIIKIEQADQNLLKAKLSPADPAQGEASINSNLKYEVKDSAVTITGCDKKASGALTIPVAIEGKSVTSIGDSAFAGCRSLTSITIPDSVTSIGENTFRNCTSLTSITIPNSVTSIGEKAFLHCTSLTNITFGKDSKLTSIGNDTFRNCTSLTSITIPDSVTSIGPAAFAYCNSLTSITIGNSVTSIGVYAFWACTSLTNITIPASVTSIGKGAFEDCTDLTAVTFLGNAPKAGEEVFKEATPTIYRKPEAKGWGDTWGGRPVKLISEKPEEPVAEAKPELEGVNDKAIVGKWEGQGIIGIFNEDGTCEALSNGKTTDTGTWSIKDGKIHTVNSGEFGPRGRVVIYSLSDEGHLQPSSSEVKEALAKTKSIKEALAKTKSRKRKAKLEAELKIVEQIKDGSGFSGLKKIK